MSRESLVLTIGVLVLFLPWIGIPDAWKTYALVVCGVLLFVTGYLLRRAAYLRTIDIGNGERGTDSFVESSMALDTTALEVEAERV
jgi:hypothetical protein